jgi:hypothetical protein
MFRLADGLLGIAISPSNGRRLVGGFRQDGSTQLSRSVKDMSMVFDDHVPASLGNKEIWYSQEYRRRAVGVTRGIAFSSILSVVAARSSALQCRAEEPATTFIDSDNKFSVDIPQGFITMPKKSVASSGDGTTSRPVEILLVAQDYAKGAALSVGKTYVPQLLQDFSVPWAEKPIKGIADVGTARIVAELLILQRQGAFGSEWFKTKLGVTASNEAAATNMDNNISEIVTCDEKIADNLVAFEFTTPVSAGVRYTIANSRLRGDFLYTVSSAQQEPLSLDM